MRETRLLRVVIAEDDDGMRAALRDTLEADARFEVVGTTANGIECLELCRALAPDVVLLDVRMPFGGVSAAFQLQALRPAPAVVVVTAQDDAGMIAGMLRAGVVGILSKGRLGYELPHLVARCAAGEVVLATRSAAEGLGLALADSPREVRLA